MKPERSLRDTIDVIYFNVVLWGSLTFLAGGLILILLSMGHNPPPP